MTTWIAMSACAESPASAIPRQSATESLRMLAREISADELLLRLSEHHPPLPVVFEGAQVIDLASGAVERVPEVHVAAGLITHVGGAREPTPGALRVDAEGRFLMPALVDAHQHFAGSGTQWLLDIAMGVTAIRDLAASTWMLHYRETVVEQALLVPTIYLAGPMLNYFDLGVYAHVVRSPEEARQRVRALAAAGFDEIKVWNVVPLEILEAVAEESRDLGVPLTGHVPHNVSLADAMSLGIDPIEHLKGYYLDNRLEITTEDYVAVTRAHPDTWITPTLNNSCTQGLRGPDARRFVEEAPGMRYVPRATSARWVRMFGAAPTERVVEQDVCRMSAEIFANLVGAGVRTFLAGTDDNGTNQFQVAGLTLHEELRRLRDGGLDNLEVLRAATRNTAAALGREGEFGAIRPGLRADLVLLAENPLDDLEHLLGERGVMVRGAWLPPGAVEGLLDALAGLPDVGGAAAAGEQPTAAPAAEVTVEGVLAHFAGPRYAALSSPQGLKRVARALRSAGHASHAVTVMDTAVARFPSYDVYESRGDALLAVADTVGALRDYRAAIQMYAWNKGLIEKLGALRERAARRP